MGIDVQALAAELLEEFRTIARDVLRLTERDVAHYGAAYFDVDRFERSLKAPHSEAMQAQFEVAVHNARLRLNLLHAAAPDASRQAIDAFSMGYGTLVKLFLVKQSVPSEMDAVRTLMTLASAAGIARGSVGTVDKHAVDAMRAAQHEQAVARHAAAVSERAAANGRRGAAGRKQRYEPLKAWILERAPNRRGSDTDITEQLAMELPKHLADLSDNPRRFIYDTLRASRKAPPS